MLDPSLNGMASVVLPMGTAAHAEVPAAALSGEGSVATSLVVRSLGHSVTLSVAAVAEDGAAHMLLDTTVNGCWERPAEIALPLPLPAGVEWDRLRVLVDNRDGWRQRSVFWELAGVAHGRWTISML